MGNKIWYELANIKYGEIYLTKYLSLQKLFKKIFKIITLILSLSGVLGWKIFKPYVWIILIIIAVMQLLSLIQNELIRSDVEIGEISQLRMKYTRYLNKIERLWSELQSGQINEQIALNNFYKLRESDWESIEELDCKLDIKQWKRMKDKTEIEANNYLNQYHER